jgi:hypothetical protein
MRVEIAKNEKFILYVGAPVNEWIPIKLHYTGGARKRNWSFGWNGERISMSTDWRNLNEKRPEMAAWVQSELSSLGWTRLAGLQAAIICHLNGPDNGG